MISAEVFDSDDAHAARRRYKKDLDHIKPDLVSYNKQKEVAMGLAPGTLVSFNPTAGSSVMQVCIYYALSVVSLIPTAALPRLYLQANSNSLRPKTYIAMRIRSFTEIANPLRMLLIVSLVKSTKSMCSSPWHDWLLIPAHNSIDKKGKFSRKRLNEEEGDITYINEHNRVFNKKVGLPSILTLAAVSFVTHSQIARYYDKYTAEIRASFERGTAL